MQNSEQISFLIREILESFFDEERIPNTEADKLVDKKQNFIGSHVFGEDLGELHKMYVAYSYGEQHPIYVWIDKKEFKELRSNETKYLPATDDQNKKEIKKRRGTWFYNERPYYVKNKKGQLKPNKWTYKHLKDLKPNNKTQARDTSYLMHLINDFKEKYKIKSNTHANLKPGEK